jgi:hypothetical protein
MTVIEATDAVLRPAFARHETFHPRYGWLRKAYVAVEEHGPDVFLREDITTVLGVGKNMVRAIRYWALAYKILDEERNEDNPRVSDVYPTGFGRQLLGEKGYDPYLEESGSLWLLHWHLLRPECRAPAWWAIFNSARSLEFNDEELLRELRAFCDERPSFDEIVTASLDKDVRCLLRMYGSFTQGRDLPEDSVDSPFVELELLRAVPGDRRQWTINRGPKRTLPDEIVVWACLDYARFADISGRLLSLSSLARSLGAPGRAFALSESALADALARYAGRRPQAIELTQAAGLGQLVMPEDRERTMAAILDELYHPAGGRR